MRVQIQRAPDPVPYRGAYVRLGPEAGEPARCALVLPAAGADGEGDREALQRLLGLLLALGDAQEGGAPIRQHWLGEDGEIEGKRETPLAPRQAAEARRLADRVRREWPRFVDNALARLRGEPRGDAHFRDPEGGWSAERAAVEVTAWPPLPGEELPPLG